MRCCVICWLAAGLEQLRPQERASGEERWEPPWLEARAASAPALPENLPAGTKVPYAEGRIDPEYRSRSGAIGI